MMKTTKRNFQVLFRFMIGQAADESPPRSRISTTEALVTSILASDERSDTVLSFTVMTTPTMPLVVTTLSPDLRAASNLACCLARWDCGRIIMKYMMTKIKTIGSNSPKGEPCDWPGDGLAGGGAAASARNPFNT